MALTLTTAGTEVPGSVLHGPITTGMQLQDIGFQQDGNSFPAEGQTKVYFTSLALSPFGRKNNHSFYPSEYLTEPPGTKDRLTRENQPEVY